MEEEIKKDFKKQKITYSIFLLITVILYLLNIRMNAYIGMMFCWVVYLSHRLFFKKIYILDITLLIVSIILNLILYSAYIYIRLDLLLGTCFTILLIYYVYKGDSKYKWYQIISSLLVIPIAMFIIFYISKDQLIKDRGLEKCIKQELGQEITLENLKMVKILFIKEREHVQDLEEIEYLKNLETLYIDGKGLKNFNGLEALSNLKELSLYKGRLKDLSNIKNLQYLENLRLRYVDVNNGDFINNFPKLKRLLIQGVELQDLSLTKELKSLEVLELSYSEFSSIEGIEYLKNLKSLELYHTKIENMDKIKELKSLENVDLCESEVGDMELLHKLPNLKKINVRKDELFTIPFQ